MCDRSVSGPDLEALAVEILAAGNALRFQARGSSMRPFVRDGDVLEVRPLAGSPIQRGDVVLCRNGGGRLVAHRVIQVKRGNGRATLAIKGDALVHPDGPVSEKEVLGHVVALERRGRRIRLDGGLQRMAGLLWIGLLPFGTWASSTLATVRRRVLSKVRSSSSQHCDPIYR